jgi:hypothetical protein
MVVASSFVSFKAKSPVELARELERLVQQAGAKSETPAVAHAGARAIQSRRSRLPLLL